MPSLEIQERLNELATKVSSIGTVLDVPRMKEKITELETEASVPNLWDDQANAQRVTSKLSSIQSELRKFESVQSRDADLPVLFELAEDAGDQGSLDDAINELKALEAVVGELEIRTLLSGEYDDREALITIRSGAGGVDAADWAEMLLRMYTRYCERHDWTYEVYDTSYAEEAGIKSATFSVKAPYAYGTLSVEQGTHRLVRISPFDNQSRRQTSFADVEVIPVLEQAESVDIPDDDLRVDVYRSSGPGGQGVNTTDSAVPYPYSNRDRCLLPERALPNPKQSNRNGGSSGKTTREPKGCGTGQDGRAEGRFGWLLGESDAFLRPAPLPNGERFAHQRGNGQYRCGPRW